MNYHEIFIRTNCLIKYLHSHVRFYISDDISDQFSFVIDASSKKSTKFILNSDILKIFCDTFMNSTKNKKWKEKKSLYRVRAKNSCFLIMLNKKSRDSKRQKKNISSYHLIDFFESRIVNSQVWFVEDFSIVKQKDYKTKKIAKKHQRWKIRALVDYTRQCELYVLKRRDWKFQIILQVWDKSSILWLISIISFNELLKLTSTNADEDNANYSKMIEEKNKSRLITTIYNDEFEKKTFSNNTKSDENDNSDEVNNDEKSINNSYISNNDDNNENSSSD